MSKHRKHPGKSQTQLNESPLTIDSLQKFTGKKYKHDPNLKVSEYLRKVGIPSLGKVLDKIEAKLIS